MPRLEITTMVGCPLQCTFCPQTNLKGAYSTHKADKYLTGENFKRIVDKLPSHVRIDFSGMSEPWANPNCTYRNSAPLAAGFFVFDVPARLQQVTRRSGNKSLVRGGCLDQLGGGRDHGNSHFSNRLNLDAAPV